MMPLILISTLIPKEKISYLSFLTEKLADKDIRCTILHHHSILFPEKITHSKIVQSFNIADASLALFSFIFLPFILLINFFRLARFAFIYKPTTLVLATTTDQLLFTLPAKLFQIPTYWLFPQSPPRMFRWLWNITSSHTTTILDFPSLAQVFHLSTKKIVIIPPATFSEQQELPIQLLPHTKQQRFILGTAGSLTLESGIEYIIKAIPIAREILPDIQLIVVGDGPEKRNLSWLISQLRLKEHIRLVGDHHREKWMKHFNLFLFTPTHSLVPHAPLLEAMGAGCPVIATDLPTTRDIITPSKQGILVPNANSEMIAQGMINLFNHPDWRETMGGLARKKIQDQFSEEKIVQAFADIFSQS